MLAQDLLIRPVITEQSMIDAQDKKYTFIVHKGANKTEIKNAVETMFKVKVENVNTMNYAGKTKRMGRNVGKTSSYKKAIAAIKAIETEHTPSQPAKQPTSNRIPETKNETSEAVANWRKNKQLKTKK